MDKRQYEDRRQKPTPPISRHILFGRRREARRSDELDNYYVDKYEWHLLFVTSLIMIFCALDAYLTLKILQLGGSEENLLMSFFMQKNLVLTLVVRLFVTVAASVFLLIHKNFKLFGAIKTNRLIYLVFCIYFVLVLYEVYSFVLITGI
ncbi:MAG: DUF5658 family protein [Candidatus Aminicenantes bacterium]|nr:DUF5658 family protein [Candidatus Aminicenantes bacterium]MDH5384034.1 DUF5658 family protein [Candidatus Aminicenantes bacterium]MDH5744970.1 DUF5658 family protein [Candidatus Aminicenantes bacterium]